MTTCQSCLHWQPRQNLTWAKLGFAQCAIGPAYTFMGPHCPACERYAPAAVEIVEKRKTMKGGTRNEPTPA